MSHANARLNVRGRLLLVDRVRRQGWAVAHAARAMGISRPRRCPRQTPEAVEAAVLKCRKDHQRGQDWIGPELGLSARTVARILRRHRVPYLRECDPMTGEVIRSSKATAVRYEKDRPGELVHMDVKKIGRIPDGGGWRAHGRSMGSTGAQKRARIGYDYVHSAVDDHTRLAYSEILPDEKGATCAGFLARAAAHLAAHGIARIEAVMTDNHFSYKNSRDVAAVLADLGARHVFIKAHCPWQNGKVERLNRTLQTEWAYRQVFTSNAERAAALAPWLEYYNTRRRHSALGGLPPLSRLSRT